MNIKETFQYDDKNKTRKTNPNVCIVQRPLNNLLPQPKRKATAKSSSSVNWKSGPNNSTVYNSTVVRSSSSSKTHSSGESRVILAISEGRGQAACEVGIAAIDVVKPTLIFSQISDTPAYINTLTKINILDPHEIIIPMTFVDNPQLNRLTEKIKSHFKNVQITAYARSAFNKSKGMQYVNELCAPHWNAVILVLHHKYYALSAAAALLSYAETALHVHFASHSMKVEYQECDGFMHIDVGTADRLELVASNRPNLKKRYSCLLDILDYCRTKSGQRKLRATILQPSSSIEEIESRLECVSALIKSPNALRCLQGVLFNLSHVDQLLTISTILSDQYENKSDRQLNYILLLKSLLAEIETLREIFEDFPQPFFLQFTATLKDQTFVDMRRLLREWIADEARPGKGHQAILQRCFAVKTGVNGLLDCLRKVYSEKLDELRDYVRQLGVTHGLNLTLNNNAKKGYHISLKLNEYQRKNVKALSLPSEFTQVERLATAYTMKTARLITVANGLDDNMGDILSLSNITVRKLLAQIQQHVALLYNICDQLAVIDMLQSLAQATLVSINTYVRPSFGDYMNVECGRHPLLDFLHPSEPTPNSIFASTDYNMHIITGPNGSGKSIFIRQLILIQIMAQVGCYVPAQQATLKIFDKILARICFDDNLDLHASAFVLEMKEMHYFLTVATPNSLIIADELCRSTSVEEGTSIAMALCEQLMKSSAFIFFTTHFKHLTDLAHLHFNIKLWQMEAVFNDNMPQLKYNVIPGVTNMGHYGITMARNCWPEHLIEHAAEVVQQFSTGHLRQPTAILTRNKQCRLKYDVQATIKQLKRQKQLTEAKVHEILLKYNNDLDELHKFDVDEPEISILESSKIEEIACYPDIFHAPHSESDQNIAINSNNGEEQFVFAQSASDGLSQMQVAPSSNVLSAICRNYATYTSTPTHVQLQKQGSEHSFSSINSQQFSRPLTNSRQRTSTPIRSQNGENSIDNSTNTSKMSPKNGKKWNFVGGKTATPRLNNSKMGANSISRTDLLNIREQTDVDMEESCNNKSKTRSDSIQWNDNLHGNSSKTTRDSKISTANVSLNSISRTDLLNIPEQSGVDMEENCNNKSKTRSDFMQWNDNFHVNSSKIIRDSKMSTANVSSNSISRTDLLNIREQSNVDMEEICNNKSKTRFDSMQWNDNFRRIDLLNSREQSSVDMAENCNNKSKTRSDSTQWNNNFHANSSKTIGNSKMSTSNVSSNSISRTDLLNIREQSNVDTEENCNNKSKTRFDSMQWNDNFHVNSSKTIRDSKMNAANIREQSNVDMEENCNNKSSSDSVQWNDNLPLNSSKAIGDGRISRESSSNEVVENSRDNSTNTSNISPKNGKKWNFLASKTATPRLDNSINNGLNKSKTASANVSSNSISRTDLFNIREQANVDIAENCNNKSKTKSDSIQWNDNFHANFSKTIRNSKMSTSNVSSNSISRTNLLNIREQSNVDMEENCNNKSSSDSVQWNDNLQLNSSKAIRDGRISSESSSNEVVETSRDNSTNTSNISSKNGEKLNFLASKTAKLDNLINNGLNKSKTASANVSSNSISRTDLLNIREQSNVDMEENCNNKSKTRFDSMQWNDNFHANFSNTIRGSKTGSANVSSNSISRADLLNIPEPADVDMTENCNNKSKISSDSIQWDDNLPLNSANAIRDDRISSENNCNISISNKNIDNNDIKSKTSTDTIKWNENAKISTQSSNFDANQTQMNKNKTVSYTLEEIEMISQSLFEPWDDEEQFLGKNADNQTMDENSVMNSSETEKAANESAIPEKSNETVGFAENPKSVINGNCLWNLQENPENPPNNQEMIKNRDHFEIDFHTQSCVDWNIFPENSQNGDQLVRFAPDFGAANREGCAQALEMFGNDAENLNVEIARTHKPFVENKMKKANRGKKRQFAQPRFVVPAKLTKRQIEQSFLRQDQQLIESNDPSRSLSAILNRPSVKQMQQVEHLVHISKTAAGRLVVRPFEQRQTRQRRKFVTPLKCDENPMIDMTMFSDKNADKLQELIGKRAASGSNSSAKFVAQKIANNDQLVNNQGWSANGNGMSYYSQNRETMDVIVSKYLKKPEQDGVVEKPSIFCQDEEDLDEILNMS